MGGELPVLKPKQVVKLLEAHGFTMVRQKGSHQQFRHSDGRATTVPMHASRDLSPILLRQICRDIDLTPQQFLNKKR